MSVPAVGWARHQGREKNLPTFARIILLTLSDILGATGKLCPSIPYLAKDTGLSENTVRKFLKVLQFEGLIDCVASQGNVTHYRLLRPAPLQDVQGSPTPARLESVTHARRAGVNGVNPRISEGGPLQMEGGTPASLAPEPLEPSREPSSACASAREEASGLRFSLVGRKSEAPAASAPTPTPEPAPEREPTPAEIAALRRRQLEDIAAMPAPMAAAVRNLANAFESKYHGSGRWPERDVDAQQAAVAPPKIRAACLSGDYLAAMRRRAGYGATIPQRSMVSA